MTTIYFKDENGKRIEVFVTDEVAVAGIRRCGEPKTNGNPAFEIQFKGRRIA